MEENHLTDEETKLLKVFIESGLADSHAEKEAATGQQKAKQRLWEALVYDFLEKSEATDLKSKDKGPDFTFICRNQKINIEAIAPCFCKQIKELNSHGLFESGILPTNFELGIIHTDFESGVIHTDNYLERWSSGISDKAKKYTQYIKDGTIQKDEVNIIAISNATSNDPLDFYCSPINKYPRINEYLYQITTQHIIKNPDGTTSYGIRESLTKQNKPGSTPIPVGAFLCDDFKHISAVLAYDYVRTKEWVLVHNINAKNPLAEETFSLDQEWQ